MSYNDFETNAAHSIETRKAGTPQRFLYPQVEINANPNTQIPPTTSQNASTHINC
jgi:hypothetical protein